MLYTFNELRRKISKILTSNTSKNRYPTPEASLKRIVLIRTNHRLGNILLMTPLIEEIVRHYPGASIDLFVKGKASEVIFEKHPNIKNILFLPKNHFKQLGSYLLVWLKFITKKYDLACNVETLSLSGKLATKFSRSRFKFYGLENPNDFEQFVDYQHMAKKIVYNFRAYLLKSQLNIEVEEISKLTLILNNDEVENGLRVLNAITQNEKKTICFFTYATSTKCYQDDYWNEFYSKLVIEFDQQYNLLEILPVENISQINFQSKNYYSKDIREIASVLSNVELFVGADSGMMHLAATATKTIGLFKVSPIEKYGPYGKNNHVIDTNLTPINDCIAIIKAELN